MPPRGAVDSHNAWIRFWGAGHSLETVFNDAYDVANDIAKLLAKQKANFAPALWIGVPRFGWLYPTLKPIKVELYGRSLLIRRFGKFSRRITLAVLVAHLGTPASNRT